MRNLVGRGGVAEQRGRRSHRLVTDDEFVPEPDDPLDVAGDVRGVGDEDDRPALAVEALEERHDLLAALGVEVPRRLVRHQDQRVGDRRAGDRHARLLAAGERGGAAVDLLDALHSDHRVTARLIGRPGAALPRASLGSWSGCPPPRLGRLP